MPQNIVSISDKGTENLHSYFKVPLSRIIKIHNGVKDQAINKKEYIPKEKIKILYPARINSGKQQIEIVKNLKGKISERLEIIFAGIGPQYEELKAITGSNPQFQCIGFVSNIPQLMAECDYVLLFSTHEGLSITLIEGTMSGMPLIINDVGGNLEIAYPEKNAFLANNWDELIKTLNSLENIDKKTYNLMSKNSRNIYEANFTYEKMIYNYKSLINKILLIK